MKYPLIALMLTTSVAYAGNLADAGLADPVVTPPAQCLIFGVIPCSTGPYHTSVGGNGGSGGGGGSLQGNTSINNPSQPDTPPSDKPSDKPADDKPKDKPKADKPDRHKPKGNASANNGRGGNYDKTGHEDNGKGEGRNKR